MPIIEAMLVVNTDISIVCERRQISAPVIRTETKPSASGSGRDGQRAEDREEDQRDDREADRLGGRQVSLESCCSPAHRAPWPIRCVVTRRRAPGSPMPSSLRRSRSDVGRDGLPDRDVERDDDRPPPALAPAAPAAGVRNVVDASDALAQPRQRGALVCRARAVGHEQHTSEVGAPTTGEVALQRVLDRLESSRERRSRRR